MKEVIDISNQCENWDKDKAYKDRDHTWVWSKKNNWWWCRVCHLFFN